MSIHLNTTADKNLVFQLKGGLFTMTSLQLIGTDLVNIEKQLLLKIQQAPKFFQNAPIVIDLQKVNLPEHKLDFKQLKKILNDKQLVPVGVKGGNSDQHHEAVIAGFAVLQEGNKERDSTTEAEMQTAFQNANVQQSPKVEPSGSNTRVIVEPVRSGQQIYARNGDLIVLAAVSHGAELLADGHIHIYGPLRGRALAGVNGDTNARIFCQSLESELISIAGQYKISEDIEKSFWQAAVEIYLDDTRLHIRPF